MSFLYVHGWVLFILSEGLTWLAALMFLVGRYQFNLKRLSQWCLLLIILCTIFQALLAGVNYYFTGKVSFFQIAIILFIIYASTLGSSDFERLDKYLQKILKQHRRYNEVVKVTNDFSSYIKARQQLFYIHTVALIFIHFVWFIIDSKTSASLSGHKLFLFNEWILQPHQGFFYNPIFNIISYMWSIVYIFDLYLFLTYMFFLWIKQIKSARRSE